jgi:hypothetical protein
MNHRIAHILGLVCALLGAPAAAQPGAPDAGRTAAEVLLMVKDNYDSAAAIVPQAMWRAATAALTEAFPAIPTDPAVDVADLPALIRASTRLLKHLAMQHPEQAAEYEATFVNGALSTLDPLTTYHGPAQHSEERRNRADRATRGKDGVVATPLEGGVVHLKIPILLPDAVRQTQDALRGSPRGAILDLRGNLGGSLDAATRLARLFLARGPILVTAARNGPEEVVQGDPHGDTTVPLVVLVDDVTSSGAEILAGALRDNDRALLVGLKTAGKGGSIQTVVELRSGGSLKLTIGHYLVGPRRVDLRKSGLLPDVDAKGEAALALALAILRKTAGPTRRELLRAAAALNAR